jgi:hypothetical protein
MVLGMPDEYVDTSGNTQQFRAFVDKRATEPEPSSKTPYILAAVLVVLLFAVVIGVVAFARG